MTAFLWWASGFFGGIAVGIQLHRWHSRRFREECVALAYRTFEGLVAAYWQDKERVSITWDEEGARMTREEENGR